MRLIDADALEKEMYHKSFEVDDGRNKWHSGLWIRYKIFEEAIRDAPTVDAVPASHEHWKHLERYPSLLFCSGCGDPQVKDSARFFRYCPTCGARMVEE